jgi:hypothetical protein
LGGGGRKLFMTPGWAPGSRTADRPEPAVGCVLRTIDILATHSLMVRGTHITESNREFLAWLIQSHYFCYNIPMEFMDKCRHHPERDACVVCQKMEVAYCQECLDNCRACTDPCLYCKFRQSCVIWELCRKEARKRCKEANEAH